MKELQIDQLTSLASVKSFFITSATTSVSSFSIIGEPEPNDSPVLYFANHSEDLKWYDRPFDRSTLVPRLQIKYPHWIFVVEYPELASKGGGNYIQVDSVDRYLEQLTEFLAVSTSAIRIGVTGSVGKTTFCRVLSKLVPNAQMIPAKRLTPLILADFFLNRLADSTRYVIAEVGFYYPGQVATLTRLFAPKIGVLLNVYDMHLVWNGVQDRYGILNEKYDLLRGSEIGISTRRTHLNYPDMIGKSLDYSDPITNADESPLADFEWLPETKTSIDLVEALFETTKKIGYDRDRIRERVKEAGHALKELARFHLVKEKEPRIFLDTHSSVAGYFQAMSEHIYVNCSLVIFSLHFAGEPISENIQRICDTFDCYSYILIDYKLRSYFNGHSIHRVEWITKKSVSSLKELSGVVIVHDPQGGRLSRAYEKSWNFLTSSST